MIKQKGILLYAEGVSSVKEIDTAMKARGKSSDGTIGAG